LGATAASSARQTNSACAPKRGAIVPKTWSPTANLVTAGPAAAASRPGIRFGLIDFALAPLAGPPATVSPEALAQLKRDLAVVVSAEALFTLTDLCGLGPDEAIASAVRTARTLTEAVTRAR